MYLLLINSRLLTSWVDRLMSIRQTSSVLTVDQLCFIINPAMESIKRYKISET